MQPKSISDIFVEYGDYKWNDGFIIGYISGLCMSGKIVWIILS